MWERADNWIVTGGEGVYSCRIMRAEDTSIA